jgi:hypothetical protein
LDVHRDYCEVAIAEDGQVRSGGRIATTPEVRCVRGAGSAATLEQTLGDLGE